MSLHAPQASCRPLREHRRRLISTLHHLNDLLAAVLSFSANVEETRANVEANSTVANGNFPASTPERKERFSSS
jgi:hypothetical protein